MNAPPEFAARRGLWLAGANLFFAVGLFMLTIANLYWQWNRGENLLTGALLGVKTILNEFIAYLQLGSLPSEALSARSRVIMLYALCGFANFGSLGIMIGGLAVMVPARRVEIVALGPKTIVSGTLTTCLLGAIVGALTW